MHSQRKNVSVVATDNVHIRVMVERPQCYGECIEYNIARQFIFKNFASKEK